MDTIVLKFGGSSVADNIKLNLVADKIKDFYNNKNRVVAVVSAQGKTTDNLIKEAATLSSMPNEREMDVYRASGAGGQHINKTSSAVRLTHIPTGIVVACQTQRSQIQNRENAMKMLKSKLLDLKERENKETIDELKGIQRDIAWGSQIRSYVFCPYTMVKDHRTNYETGNIQAVMDGEIDGFIESYLKSNIK